MIYSHEIDLSDLSFSGLCNQIDHDERTAAEVLDACAHELIRVRADITESLAKLNALRSTERSLLCAGGYIAKHLKRELPMAVATENYLVVLSEENLSIERNVILALRPSGAAPGIEAV